MMAVDKDDQLIIHQVLLLVLVSRFSHTIVLESTVLCQLGSRSPAAEGAFPQQPIGVTFFADGRCGQAVL